MFEDFVEDEEIVDRRSELLPPREMSECIGHREVEQNLLDIIESGNIPHAMIFAGPEGIGKATMAFRLTRYLLNRKDKDEDTGGLFGDDLPSAKAESLYVDPEERIFSQIASGGHPDLLTVERAFDEKKGEQQPMNPVCALPV